MPERVEGKERISASVSVAALITPRATPARLVMVRNGENGWGLPAGGIKHGEMPQGSLLREINEEAGLKKENLLFRGQIIKGMDGETYVDQNPIILWVPAENKTRVGHVYRLEYVGPRLASEGWENPTEDSVDLVKVITTSEVGELVVNSVVGEAGRDSLYIPEFNEQALIWWLVDRLDGRGRGPKYLEEILEDLYRKGVSGLIKTNSVLKGWYYDTSAGLHQNPRAERRKSGRFYGGNPYSFGSTEI